MLLSYTVTILLALNLHFYNLSKFGGLETFKQFEQGHEIEKLHVFAGSRSASIDIPTICS